MDVERAAEEGFPADHPQVPFPGVDQLIGDLTGR